MKVLITGGAGFIGFHLANKLAKQGYRVDLADNFSRGVKDSQLENLISLPNIKFFSLDLFNSQSFNQLDKDYHIVFHLAAIIGVPIVMGRPYDVLTQNTILLANIIDFCKKQHNLSRLFFTSTSEIYAGTLKYFDLVIPTPEDTPLAITDLKHPRTSYMLSKI